MISAPVLYDQKKEAYFSGTSQYRRVSHVLDLIKVPFDRDGISLQMAIREVEQSGGSLAAAQERILKGWDFTRDDAIDHGNNFHDACEEFFRYGTVKPGFEKLMNTLKSLMMDYKSIEPEVVLFLHRARMAGTTDLRCRRQSTKNSVVDYFDYKTNKSKGIYYDSMRRNAQKEIIKHYNKFFLSPLDHLEDCNFNGYALQLSLYAYMDQEEHGTKVGKLGLLYISPQQNVKYLPVPYMRMEAEALVNHLMRVKPLPAA